MKYRPALFKGEMVRAILDRRKTMTRRTSGLDEINENPSAWGFVEMFEVGSELYALFDHKEHSGIRTIRCPYGKPGDRLWVKETWGTFEKYGKPVEKDVAMLVYRSDGGAFIPDCGWKPSIHMPRWASRITLEVVSVRVERLNSISPKDCIREGIEIGWFCERPDDVAMGYFRGLWERINGEGSWAKNDWVWVIEFKVVEVRS